MKHCITLLLSVLVLLMNASLTAQSDCDPNGDGNPDLNHNDGGGQGVGADHTMGNIAWSDLALLCEQQVASLGTPDYDPGDYCNNSSSIIPQGGPGDRVVRVAIIDSGVSSTEPGRFNSAHLFSFTVSSDGLVKEGGAHPHPHGTYSAGIISGLLSSQGSETEHEFYDYQVLNEELRTSLTAVVAAIDHAVYLQVNVISLSIGFLPFECDNVDWENPDSPLYSALERARQAGVVVITSAGNDSNDLGEYPQYPAAYVNLENVVSVGALRCDTEDPTEFSNYGETTVDLFTTGAHALVYFHSCYFRINGTSFATSIVAGKAALHFTSTDNTDEILNLLRTETKPFSGGQQYSIHGIVNVAGTSPEAGSKTDNLNRAGGEKKLQDSGTSNYSVNPNPFQEQLKLKFGEGRGSVMVSLFDARGRKVITRSVKQSELSLDLNHLSPGVYWLNVQDDEGNHTRKVIKQ